MALSLSFCGRSASSADPDLAPVYNARTGKLELLRYDSNKDGTIDIWSHMDGARVVRIEMDTDGDGKRDRWEYYAADQKLEKLGFSRAHDGVADAWLYRGADGQVARIEISGARDGRITRIERYRDGLRVGADEDTNGDGATDKWETYEDTTLTSVAFDTRGRGVPDRRLVYRRDGSFDHLELDHDGSGRLRRVSSPDSPQTSRGR